MSESRICYRELHRYKYQLLEDFTLQVRPEPALEQDIITDYVALRAAGELTIKARYAWDGPSGPTIDTKSFMRGALVHDAFYQLMREKYLGQEYRRYADDLLRELCLEDGMWRWRAWYVHKAVRWFAARYARPAQHTGDARIHAP